MYHYCNYETRYWVHENPIAELWDILSLHLVPNNLNSFYERTFNRQFHDTVDYFYRQGFELNTVSQSTIDSVNPLLQFYSFSTITKILIMLLGKKKPENLAHSHGLSVKVNLSKCRKLQMSDISVQISRGIFLQLLESVRETDCSSYLEQEFSLEELLKHDIDLYDYAGSLAMPIKGFSVIRREDRDRLPKAYQLVINLLGKGGQKTLDEAKTKYSSISFDGFHSPNISVMGQGCPILYDFDDKTGFPHLVLEKHYNDSSFAIPFIHNTKKEQTYLYQIEILYMISFVASNLVRYYPKIWTETQSDRDNFWDLHKSLKYMNRSYPNYLLNLISKRFHVVMPPGVLSRS